MKKYGKRYGYEPIFKGQLPSNWQTRWTLIRKFVDFWCLGHDTPLADRSNERTILIEQAERLHNGNVSTSIRHWLSLAEEAVNRDSPHIRDCPIVEPIEDQLNAPDVTDATVMLMQGEGDILWTVADNRSGDDDPPVDLFQIFDEISSPYLGSFKNVSEFTLEYLLIYNTHAKTSKVCATAKGSQDDLEVLRDWFQYSLVIKTNGGTDESRIEFLEKRDVAAVVSDNGRIELSFFCDPSSIDTPRFLREQMNDYFKSREKFITFLENLNSKSE